MDCGPNPETHEVRALREQLDAANARIATLERQTLPGRTLERLADFNKLRTRLIQHLPVHLYAQSASINELGEIVVQQLEAVKAAQDKATERDAGFALLGQIIMDDVQPDTLEGRIRFLAECNRNNCEAAVAVSQEATLAHNNLRQWREELMHALFDAIMPEALTFEDMLDFALVCLRTMRKPKESPPAHE